MLQLETMLVSQHFENIYCGGTTSPKKIRPKAHISFIQSFFITPIGKIWVYDVGESLALPGADEWGKFAHTLQDMRVNKSGNAADIDDYDKDHKGGVRHDHSGSVGVPGSSVVGTGPGSLSSLTSLSSSPLR